MQTKLLESFKETSDGQLAEDILRTCVHCGFCNATCPTYQLLGNENDGPRGRIYLIKQMMEGQVPGEKTLKHLDRCLTCRNCETTCPSGVQYSKLLDIGRNLAESQIPREAKDKTTRQRLRKFLPKSGLFSASLSMGRAFKFAVPKNLKKKIPTKVSAGQWPAPRHDRKMLVLAGCVQPALSPDINAATARVLDQLGISLIQESNAGCCGAVSQHLGASDEALQFMRNNIDAWLPHIESGVEAIIMTASGCGMTVKEYDHYLRDDPEYAEKAKTISNHCKDIAEIIAQENYQTLSNQIKRKKLAWHPPCSLQHGQKITGAVEKIIDNLGYTRVPVQDNHLCCGSAGTYSILQPELSEQLRDNKLTNLQKNQPDMIVTANIGCQTHLQETANIPVKHWIHLLDPQQPQG
jgi:glycolate oxidase iron-sulfur subunit